MIKELISTLNGKQDAPKGEITIKSSITVNWVIASKAIANFWYDEKGAGLFISYAIKQRKLKQVGKHEVYVFR